VEVDFILEVEVVDESVLGVLGWPFRVVDESVLGILGWSFRVVESVLGVLG